MFNERWYNVRYYGCKRKSKEDKVGGIKFFSHKPSLNTKACSRENKKNNFIKHDNYLMSFLFDLLSYDSFIYQYILVYIIWIF